MQAKRVEGNQMDAKTLIARRVAQEIRPGMLVNLGIGLPSLVAGFVPAQAGVFSKQKTASSALVPDHPKAWKIRTSPMRAGAL